MTHALACPFRESDERSRPLGALRSGATEPSDPSAIGSGTAW
jgi:hypothetical protein